MKKICLLLWFLSIFSVVSIWDISANSAFMSFHWDIKVNWSSTETWITINAFCWDSDTKIWSITNNNPWVYWDTVSNKLLIDWKNCHEDIFLQVVKWDLVSWKLNSKKKFDSWDFYRFDITVDYIAYKEWYNLDEDDESDYDQDSHTNEKVSWGYRSWYIGSYNHSVVYDPADKADYWPTYFDEYGNWVYKWPSSSNPSWLWWENSFYWWDILNYSIDPELKSDFSTYYDINLEKLTDWEFPVSVVMKSKDWKYYFKINKWTKALFKNWEAYDWKINAPLKLTHTAMPEHKWEQVAIRALELWKKWEDIFFSESVNLFISYNWLSSYVEPNNIYIYSYNEVTEKYVLENENRVIDRKNKIISIDVSHFTKFIMTDWKLAGIPEKNIKIPFKDISWHWAEWYIEDLYKKWVLANKAQYNPDEFLTRAEMIKMIVETFWYWKIDDDSNIWFKDIVKNAWYTKYLSSAVKNWIVNWPEISSSFKPWEFVNRAEAIKMILEASWLEIEDAPWYFTDVSDQWFKKYVNFSVKKFIDRWYSDWTFRPWNDITRWEVAKMLMKTVELID